MKTCLKILWVVLVAVACLKFLPFLLALAVIGLAGALVAGTVLAGGIAALAALGLALGAALLAAVLVATAVLAPVWLPVLAVIGLISLFRRNRVATA